MQEAASSSPAADTALPKVVLVKSGSARARDAADDGSEPQGGGRRCTSAGRLQEAAAHAGERVATLSADGAEAGGAGVRGRAGGDPAPLESVAGPS